MSFLSVLFHGFSGGAFAALLALIFSIGSLGYGLYRAAPTEKETVEKAEATEMQTKATQTAKERLADLLLDGQSLLRRVSDEKLPALVEDVDKWSDEAEAFLRGSLGAPYVVRFRDASGLPPGYTSLISEVHVRLQSGIRVRNTRLQQFLSEMPISITVPKR